MVAERRSEGLGACAQITFTIFFVCFVSFCSSMVPAPCIPYSKADRLSGEVAPIHKAQLLNYMKLLNVPLGLLFNFHELKLADGISRLILPGANQL
jgi:hypothetical protein